jgi:DNA-binding CsgD family transcriptional regulator/tetratricopeptide (TPR) repeat protein
MWLEAALANRDNTTEAAQAKALVAVAHLAESMGDYTNARAYIEQGRVLLRRLDDKVALAFGLYLLGQITHDTGEYAMARACAKESLSLFDEPINQWGRPHTLHLLGQIAAAQGDVAQAVVYTEEVLAFYRQKSYKRGLVKGLIDKGVVMQLQGNWKYAVALYEESLAIGREIGDKWMIAEGLHRLGENVLHQGNTRRAAPCFAEALNLSRGLGDRSGIAMNLAGLAGVAAAQGHPERSARLFGAAAALLEASGQVVKAVDRTEYDRNAAVARAQVGEDAFAAAWEAGRAMTIEQAIAYALEPPATPPTPTLLSVPQPTIAVFEYLAGLTRREVEVLRLVAQGLTDVQIAERLIISAHTVHAHLRSIYGKLDVTSRAAATHIAVEHQLVCTNWLVHSSKPALPSIPFPDTDE